ncbi:hypothetical protein EX895_004156 [Sporisorium graminicola]|uniref:Amidohydrolase-related domain-containing protein n=1 Tax=Sporisorium graminicola TaxID=280036 RepID=A0A4U7KU77_9BASI|nr:hypothetical protein EX895_004156 [Sporisorium graminicola]TKY86868.1 hypothetical protein EX895_004156 [Sporisorium graminicola]
MFPVFAVARGDEQTEANNVMTTPSSSRSKVASTLTIRNVRLPPEAYASLDDALLFPNEQQRQELPLVDLEYVHYQPDPSSPSTTTVEVKLSASVREEPNDLAPVEKPFNRFAPFSHVSQDTPDHIVDAPPAPSPATNRPPPPPPPPKLLVARFTAPTVTKTDTCSRGCIDARGSIAVPGGLCHPHIHLDKCYLLDRCALATGSFDEALTSTAEAKAKFTKQDVMARMRRLIASSVSHGVTSMRAFVEVDPTVGLMCVEAAVQLKHAFEASCHVQIVAFAQDAIFYPDDKGKEERMHKLLREAASREEVDVVGSAPYVEALGQHDQHSLPDTERKRKQKEQQQRNIRFVFELARQHGKHVDFHLDYDLDPPGSEQDGQQSMIPFVVSLSQQSGQLWKHANGKQRGITLGHCTKLSTFTQADLDELAARFATDDESVPRISFVSLPPSDLYMQGRSAPYASRSRATLPLLALHSNHALQKHTNWAMGVNNVANLFTPQGDADPLALLPMMVGVWQSAKPDDCAVLLGAVSWGARVAAGFDSGYRGGGETGRSIWTDLTVVDGSVSVQEVVCAPSYSRIALKDGRVVSRRRVESALYPLLTGTKQD